MPFSTASKTLPLLLRLLAGHGQLLKAPLLEHVSLRSFSCYYSKYQQDQVY